QMPQGGGRGVGRVVQVLLLNRRVVFRGGPLHLGWCEQPVTERLGRVEGLLAPLVVSQEVKVPAQAGAGEQAVLPLGDMVQKEVKHLARLGAVEPLGFGHASLRVTLGPRPPAAGAARRGRAGSLPEAREYTPPCSGPSPSRTTLPRGRARRSRNR